MGWLQPDSMNQICATRCGCNDTKYKQEKKRKRKDSAGCDNTASLIKGGGYLGARTRQPPTAQTNKLESNVGQGGCVP